MPTIFDTAFFSLFFGAALSIALIGCGASDGTPADYDPSTARGDAGDGPGHGTDPAGNPIETEDAGGGGGRPPAPEAGSKTNDAEACGAVLSTFDGSLEGWTFSGTTGYGIALEEGGVAITGDAPPPASAGIIRTFDVTRGSLVVSFRYRASSEYTGASFVTNANIELTDDATDAVLYRDSLVTEATQDTGIRDYKRDLSSYVPKGGRIRIQLYHSDGWSTAWGERTWFDDVSISPKCP